MLSKLKSMRNRTKRLARRVLDGQSANPSVTPSGEVVIKVPFDRADVEAWQTLTNEEQNERNVRHLRQKVLQWEGMPAAEAARNRWLAQPFFFTHVPKTGGTSLEHIIAKNYNITGVNRMNGPAVSENPAGLFKMGVMPHAVMGHYELNYLVYQGFTQPTVHTTMLRDPVKRVISFYNWIRESPNHPQHAKAMSMPLIDFLRDHDRPETRNGQMLRLSGRMGAKYVRNPKKAREALEIAKENLLTIFSFFGLLERFDEFLLTCHIVLGWRDILYERRNVSARPAEKTEVTDADLDFIREHNALDVEFHDFARKIVEERDAHLGITPERVKKFREANATFSAILAAGH
ncbi:MAG: sulfotransferase family 2 domain-containing protein [Phycisphaeraceae bacterium]|nr:sulfotransferase family 2 domain-containing protein [Phycisphaerales bacterium]QOJ17210.1 MAG: sulfotransferase family 2 domain-containing protein [Phycisphaeraceae bacterium]